MARHVPSVFRFARVTGTSSVPATIEQRANAFAAALEDCESAMLVVTRDDAGVRSFVSVAGPGASVTSAVTSLAHAVGARADQVDELPVELARVPAVARMLVRSSHAVARENLIGLDPSEVARQVANRLRVGDWVAVSIRTPSERERVRNQDWISARLSTLAGTHQSQSRNARVISVFAGSSSGRAARSLLSVVASVMQGFDLQVRGESLTSWSAARPWVSGVLVAIAAAAGLAWWSPAAELPRVALLRVVLIGVAVVCGLVAAARLFGWWPTLGDRVRLGVDVGVLPEPPSRLSPPKAPQDARVDDRGRKRKAQQGSYPLHPASFLVQPSIFIGLVSPHGSTDSGVTSAQQRKVPHQLATRVGPMLGEDDGQPAYLSSVAAPMGVAVLGRPGSGKSVLVRSLFGWSCMERRAPSGLPGTTGASSTLIAFESKNAKSVAEYAAWAEATGDKLVEVEMADATSWAIDLFATPGTIAERASAFVNAMVYAFGEGDIQNRSFEALRRIFTGALCLDGDRSMVAGLFGGEASSVSVMRLADVLIGNQGDDRARMLAEEVLRRSKNDATRTADVVLAAEALAYLFEGRTESARRNLVEAAQNKVSQLAAVDHWWAPTRRRVTWDQVLATQPSHRAVVVNTGAAGSGLMIDERLTQLMASLLMFTLQQAIKRNCDGWEDAGRSVSIFSDELSLIAGTTPEVILWLKDQGRAFGVRPVLATQRPSQLPKSVRDLVLNFGSLVCFNQDSVSTAEEVAREMSGADGQVDPQEIMHLPEYHCMVRAYAGKERQPAFVVRTSNFEADRVEAIRVQGYAFGARPAPVALVAPVVVEEPAEDDGYFRDLMGGE